MATIRTTLGVLLDTVNKRRELWIRELGGEAVDNQITVTPENQPEFYKRLGELMGAEVELAVGDLKPLGDLITDL